MVNTGAPIWEDYCPNKVCTGFQESFKAEMRRAHKAHLASEQVKDTAHELLAMLKHAVHWHDQISAADVARYQAVIDKAERLANTKAAA
jgi:hypothetical protein